MITADQLKDIKERTDALKQYLAIDEKIIQVGRSSYVLRHRDSGTMPRRPRHR